MLCDEDDHRLLVYISFVHSESFFRLFFRVFIRFIYAREKDGDIIFGIFWHFFRKIAIMHTYKKMKWKIEAHLVRLSVVHLPAIPGFCRPIANDSLRLILDFKIDY